MQNFSLNSDSKQIDFFTECTEATDPSNRFAAGNTIPSVVFDSTGHQENGDTLFAEFLSLVRELEDRLTQTDPNEKVIGLRERMLDMQDAVGGSTVFHHVTTYDRIRYAEILWEAGADTNTLRNNRGNTVAEWAATLGPVDIHRNDHGRMSRQLGTEVNRDARYQCHAGLGVGLLFEGRAASRH